MRQQLICITNETFIEYTKKIWEKWNINFDIHDITMARSSGNFGLLGLFIINQLASHKTGSAGFSLQHCNWIFNFWFNCWGLMKKNYKDCSFYHG